MVRYRCALIQTKTIIEAYAGWLSPSRKVAVFTIARRFAVHDSGCMNEPVIRTARERESVAIERERIAEERELAANQVAGSRAHHGAERAERAEQRVERQREASLREQANIEREQAEVEREQAASQWHAARQEAESNPGGSTSEGQSRGG